MNVRITLRTKLMVMLVAACALVLGVACAAFVLYDRDSSGLAKERTMTVLSDTIAGSTAGAVAFGDGQSAKYVLEKLSAEDTALAAAVYTLEGARLSGWERTKADALPEKLADAGPTGFTHHTLVLERPVASEGNKVGTLRVAVSTRDLDERTRRFLTIAAIIFGACTLLATLASLRLHRVITGPVQELASTAMRVQETKDYRLRAKSMTDDELGLLTHAFNEMLQSVQARDEELEHHRTNLANLGEGLMSNERSARFDAWFGAPVAGEAFSAHLERKVPGFAASFAMAWDQVLDGFLPLEVTIGQMPARLVMEGRTFELAFTPMLDGEVVKGALVAVTDVTRVVEAEARQAAERELVAAVSRLVADRSSFVDFVEETERLIAGLSSTDQVLVLRGLHTIKGTGALFGVESLAKACHQLEDELEAGERPADLQARVAQTWRAFRERINPFIGEEDGRVTVTRGELSSLAARLEQGHDVRTAAQALRRWLLEPTEPRLKLLAQRGRVLADRLGKSHVEFEVHDEGVRLHREPTARLWGVLVHLVRNALDHGIEAATEREQQGKPSQARLTFRARSEPGRTVLEFSDDGRGVDWARVAKKSSLESPSQADLVAALFSDGFSTKDAASETSGRGIGLSAVADVVRELGGTIDLESQPGHGTTFRLIIPEHPPTIPRAA
jgi:two-component system chemotaxis sensor kinase CheA